MSFAGYRAKNHRQQVDARGADDGVDERITPADVFKHLDDVHGFTVDAAASAENTRLPRFFDRAQDGLAQSWRGETVWCNPPYSNIAAWVEKAVLEVTNGCRLVVMLLPANRCEQTWWQKHIEPRRDRGHCAPVIVQFLANRRRFGWPAGRVAPRGGDRPPFGLVVVKFKGEIR